MQFSDYGVKLSSAGKNKIEWKAANLKIQMSRHWHLFSCKSTSYHTNDTYSDKKKPAILTVLSSLFPHLAFYIYFKRKGFLIYNKYNDNRFLFCRNFRSFRATLSDQAFNISRHALLQHVLSRRES